MKQITKGNPKAKILLIGEALGSEEKSAGRPFVGTSGRELDLMLMEAGILPDECFFTNIFHDIPPTKLWDTQGPSIENCFYSKTAAKEHGIREYKDRFPNQDIMDGITQIHELINEMKPNVVVALGNTPMWALTGETGITIWRGSIMEGEGGFKVIPTFNPAAIMRNWPWRWILVQDLRRIADESAYPEIRFPNYIFHLRPSFDAILTYLNDNKGKVVAVDIETWSGKIDCIGIGISEFEVMNIPIIAFDKREGHWSAAEEVQLIMALREFLTKSKCVFQNGLFDVQHIVRQWGFIPFIYGDTQVQQHICWPGISDDTKLRGKSLFFISSMYCDYYSYWKLDARRSADTYDGETEKTIYNCKDVSYTYESFVKLGGIIKSMGLEEQYQLLMDLHGPLLEMMLRGLLVDEQAVRKLDIDLMRGLAERSEWFEQVLGHPLNPRSPKQMKALFYDDFGIKEIRNRKTGKPSLDDDALKAIKKRQPMLVPLVDKIIESRSLGIFRSNFVMAQRDQDRRMRFSLSPANVETFRLNCSKTIFGTGCNMQTVPSGKELEDQ